VRRSAWERIEPLLARVERPARYIDSEWGAVRAGDASYRVALAYPDTYELGMSNQALQILYQVLNGAEGVSAERVYVPWVDMGDALREEGVDLFALESASPIREFDLLGITLPYELTYTNVLELIDLAGIPLRAAGRTEGDPLVVGGGPCAFNPEPIAPFFDVILLGEGEDAVLEIVEAHRTAKEAGSPREDTLERLAAIPGVYVPSVQPGDGNAVPVLKRVVDMESAAVPECPVVPYMDVVHDRAMIEVLRGCTRGCRFCQAGMIYRPVRERDADAIVRSALAGLACTGYEEVSLTSLSSTDHSQLEEVMRRLARRLSGSGISISLPSLRVDAFSIEMARAAAAGRPSGLTLAPEAGTQRMRDVINKNVTEEELLSVTRQAFSSGWRRMKLYFMIGLPTETDDDIAAIGDLIGRVLAMARESVAPEHRGSVRIAVSVSTFVPKAHTPFQWGGLESLAEIERRQGILREAMPRKGIDLSWHDAEVSYIEAILARGDRSLASVVERVWREGGRFDAWTERFDLERWRRALAEEGLDPDELAARSYDEDDPLPWDHLSSGVSSAYLWRERERALAGTTTPDCSFDACTGCDVCDDLGVEITLGGESRGTG
jgi:radical SAM family uncharacterized protein